MKVNFFSTDLASISDETGIKNSKVVLSRKINKAFIDIFCIMDDFLKFHVVCLNMETFKYGKNWRKALFILWRVPENQHWGTDFPTTTILLYNAIHVWSKTIIFHFILTFWAVFSSESFLLYNFQSSVRCNLWFFWNETHN